LKIFRLKEPRKFQYVKNEVLMDDITTSGDHWYGRGHRKSVYIWWWRVLFDIHYDILRVNGVPQFIEIQNKVKSLLLSTLFIMFLFYVLISLITWRYLGG